MVPPSFWGKVRWGVVAWIERLSAVASCEGGKSGTDVASRAHAPPLNKTPHWCIYLASTHVDSEIYTGSTMALHIRDQRAAKLARRLAARKGTTMTQAVVTALEGALAREERPLAERLDEIAREAERLGNRVRGRTPTKQEIDELWGNE